MVIPNQVTQKLMRAINFYFTAIIPVFYIQPKDACRNLP